MLKSNPHFTGGSEPKMYVPDILHIINVPLIQNDHFYINLSTNKLIFDQQS